MKKTVVFLIILLFSLFVPARGDAADARIDKIMVRWSQGPLSVSFSVKDAFNEEIEEAILSGIPTSFTFFVKLDRVRSLWLDEGVGSWEFRHTVKYDTLKEEYEITLDEGPRSVVRTKDFNEMKMIMATGSSIAIMPVTLAIGATYEVSIKAQMHAIELPSPLNYLFFFMTIFDFETGWHTYRFSP